MDNIRQQLLQLKADLDTALKRIDYDRLKKQLADLDKQITNTNFWIDNPKASSITQEQAKLSNRLGPWRELKTSVYELLELSQLPDNDLLQDIERQFQTASQKFELLKDELKFNGKYDEHEAIVSIYAGAGGTDAQDWAAILFRMYMR